MDTDFRRNLDTLSIDNHLRYDVGGYVFIQP